MSKRVGGETVSSVKVWKYFELGSYEWISYKQVVQTVTDIGSGLAHLGLQATDKVTLFASTSADWMLMAHACFSQNLIVTTAYDTLGEDGLSFSLNECSSSTLFTNVDLLEMIPSVAKKVPSLKTIIYNGTMSPEVVESWKSKTGLAFYSIQEVRQLGIKFPSEDVKPSPDDISCIMYTSGSTGNPKGVMLTHANIVCAVAGAIKSIESILTPDETYLAYLPMAHVLEFMVEQSLLFAGFQIGYGSPRTLTDASVRNCKGDIGELRPTLMAGVPAVWEAIRKAVLSKVNGAGFLAKNVFYLAFHLKWILIKLGLPTSFLDSTVFAAVRKQVGGRLKYALVGGAPIATETQKFFTICVCQLGQGYGMTETCGTICLQGPLEYGNVGVVGCPTPNTEIKLVAVPNSSYDPNGNPPRGEVWARGGSVMKGYFKQEKLSREAFGPDGWLKTGDIGEWRPDGTLAIIDRIKNLVKLSHGEYVALEKLESVYKTSALVNGICVHADPSKDYIIALIVPVEKEVRLIASALHSEEQSFEFLCKDQGVIKAILADLGRIAKETSLKPAELIRAVTLSHEEWTPQNGFLTAASKIKRKDIVIAFESDIKAIYL